MTPLSTEPKSFLQTLPRRAIQSQVKAKAKPRKVSVCHRPHVKRGYMVVRLAKFREYVKTVRPLFSLLDLKRYQCTVCNRRFEEKTDAAKCHLARKLVLYGVLEEMKVRGGKQ